MLWFICIRISIYNIYLAKKYFMSNIVIIIITIMFKLLIEAYYCQWQRYLHQLLNNWRQWKSYHTSFSSWFKPDLRSKNCIYFTSWTWIYVIYEYTYIYIYIYIYIYTYKVNNLIFVFPKWIDNIDTDLGGLCWKAR